MAGKPDEKINVGKQPVGIASTTPTTGQDPGAALTNPLLSYFNQTLASLRDTGRNFEAIRTLGRVHGDFSAAISTAVRLADTPCRFKVYDKNHQLSPDGSNLLRSIIVRMNNLADYSQGFDDRPTFETVKENLLRSIPLTGACAVELVLDKARLPYRLQPVSVEALKFKNSKDTIGGSGDNKTYRIVPYISAGSNDIDLDIPTFFYASLDQDLTTAYSYSPMEPGINTSFFHAETVDDIRRVVKRSGHSRLLVSLMVEEIKKSAPPETQMDADKLQAWLETVRTTVEDQIGDLKPEDALILYDSAEASYLNSEIGASADYKPLMETIDSILATALKTPAAVVGKRTSTGSQNTSSTESLLYIKTAEGMHTPVESVLSRAMTLAVRLFGFDGYVQCKLTPIDLRPEIELEAFRSMHQARILELLSLGFLSDDEAAELLDTGPRAPGAPALSGTMFYSSSAAGGSVPNTNNDPVKRALTPETPSSTGGKNG